MRNGTQRSMALQALMSPGSTWFSGLNTFAFIQFARRPYFIKVKRLPSCASNNHAGRQSLWFLVRWKPSLLWPIWTGTIVPRVSCVCVCVCVCVCASVCVRVKEERETGKEREESELVLPVLIPASQLVLCWPEPRLLQPDDWFLFGAMPMGLIKSKCKLTLITNCRENASSQLPLRGGPGLLWQVKNPMSFPELSSPAHTAWIFPLNPTETEDFFLSPLLSVFIMPYTVCSPPKWVIPLHPNYMNWSFY